MKKITSAALLILTLGACNTSPKFTVEGNVTDAKGKTIYLEASKLDGIQVIDSVKLKDNGSFTFKETRPESPEFYRLRIGDKTINFSIDSTETVTFEVPYSEFSTNYTVSGSNNSQKIKELTLKQLELQNNVNELINSLRNNQITHQAYEEKLNTLINNYKDEVKTNYIFNSPQSASAYFALFQKLNSYLIFDPLNNKDDVKCFAAVATSLDHNYPHALRSKNLYNIVIKGMKNTRPAKEEVIELPEDSFNEVSLIDISLRDMKGNSHKLSDLKGKVVLLDFTVYQSQAGAPHNLMLRELYNKYADKGFEIYQVSLDADEHFWKTSANNLPWIAVRDGNGIYSNYAATYNVQQVPSIFLINRNNELKARGEDIKDLESEIKSLL